MVVASKVIYVVVVTMETKYPPRLIEISTEKAQLFKIYNYLPSTCISSQLDEWC